MSNDHFEKFAPLIQSMSAMELDQEIDNPRRLLLESGSYRTKNIDIAYAPFDHVNRHASLVIVGLTPGRQQMRNSLVEAHRLLKAGRTIDEARQGAKIFASFSGPMRSNLVGMLEDIGVARVIGVSSTAALWDQDQHLVHFTSALRYPVFVDGANYSGNPDILTTPILIAQLQRYFSSEMECLRNALFVPLGPKVAAAVKRAAKDIGINQNQVLAGLPHPSGANAERIAYFRGLKERTALSSKTNPLLLDEAREELLDQVSMLARGAAHV